LGTHWEQGKKTKNPSPPSPNKNKKQKNWTVQECTLSLPIGYMKILFLFVIIFGLG
jgi:hypothetical protein